MNPINANKFASLCGLIKNVKRAGWTRYLKNSEVESVADHSCRIAMLTMALADCEKINKRKCMEMALIHDVGEGIVGDITPYDKITYTCMVSKEIGKIRKITQSHERNLRALGRKEQ